MIVKGNVTSSVVTVDIILLIFLSKLFHNWGKKLYFCKNHDQ